jgi:uncharacterized protein YihD (DUF1040 family)
MRDPIRIDRMIELLRTAWHKTPDQRLGQLLCNMSKLGDSDIWQIEDDVWERKLNWTINCGLEAARETI